MRQYGTWISYSGTARLPLALVLLAVAAALCYAGIRLPLLKVSRATFFSLALMLAVFAVWALAGFGYPSAPVPTALNVTSKIVAFVATLTLFLPQRTPAQTGDLAAGQPRPQTSD